MACVILTGISNGMKNNNVSGKYRKKIERSKKEEGEYGAGKKDFGICEKCNAVYYYKSWKHGFSNYKHLNENKSINFITCPACKMIKDKKFEGKVIFENVPKEYREEILNNIKNTGERAYKRDPMDRVIEVSEPGDNIEVTTTENQLARNIARQIERAHKGAKADIKWSKEESTARIVVRFG